MLSHSVMSGSSRWITPWGPLAVVVPFASTLITYVVIDELARSAESAPGWIQPFLPIWGDLKIAVALSIPLLCFFPAYLYRYRWFLEIGNHAFPTRLILIGLAIGLSLGALFSIGLSADPDYPYMETSAVSVPGSILFAIIGVAVLAPLAEEGFFRVLLYGWARRHWGPAVSTAVTSSFFALCHGLEWKAVLALALGVIASIVYERTRSFVFCVALHGACNLTILGLRLWAFRYGGIQ